MTKWQDFRDWRRSRPFRGGVLTILAGLVIIGSMNLELHGGTIAIGQEGFTGYLIAFVLIITGPLAWFLPAQRHFYGLVAVFVALYSLIGVNLGGFFVGMLLGVIGGGLMFAWAPDEPAPTSEPEAATVAAPELRDSVPAPREPADDSAADPKGAAPRHAVMAFIAAAMTLSLATVIAGQGQAGAVTPCTPATSSPSPSPTGSSGTIIGDILDWLGRLVGGGGSTDPSPTASPKPTPCPDPTSSASTKPQPTGSAKPTASPSPTKSQVKVLQAAAGQPPVAKRPSRMTGTRVTMFNLVFDGVVDLPTVDGTIRVLRFSMSQSDTNDFLLHVYGRDGRDIDLKSSKLTVRGGTVHFYTSRFQGNLFGLIPVDYTPDSLPPPIPLPLVFFTNPNVALVWVEAPILEAPNLRINLVKS